MVTLHWLRYLNASLHRWTPTTLPSPPLLAGSSILCIWNHLRQTTLMLLQPQHHWAYLEGAEGNYTLRQLQEPSPHSGWMAPARDTWLLSTPCPRCGRPRPLSAIVSEAATTPITSAPGACCWWTAPGEALTSQNAAQATVTMGCVTLPGMLPTTLLRRSQCSPSAAAPWEQTSPHFHAAYTHPAVRPQQPADTEPLRIMSINCGGLTEKIPRLLALLDYSDPDVTCLQEVGSYQAAQALYQLPYRVWTGTATPSGGLAILVHRRLIRSGGRPPSHHADAHMLGITFALDKHHACTIVNLHLPPSLSHPARRGICHSAAAFLARAPFGVCIICGDMNESFRSGGGG